MERGEKEEDKKGGEGGGGNMPGSESNEQVTGQGVGWGRVVVMGWGRVEWW